MAFSLGLVKVNAMVFMCMVVVTPFLATMAGAITCDQVLTDLTPCIDYLRNGGAVPPACCSGVTTLNDAATTTADRQDACNCMKAEATSIEGLNIGYASQLPGKCGVNIPYPISPSFNCSLVH